MKKREFLAFYKQRYEGKNMGGGAWEFILEEEGDYGFLKIMPRLLKSPPLQHIEPQVYMAPSWFAELVREIREDNELNHLFWGGLRCKPENGEVLEEHLPEILAMAQEWYKEQSKPEVMGAFLKRIYEFGPSIGPVLKNRFYYSCVLKGDVELLEAERLAQENGTTKLPPAFSLKFFTNAVRLAKEYRSGARVCPIDF